VRDTKVFLTGASGTVGGGVLEAFVADGEFEVVCLARGARTAAAIEARGGRAVIGDMTDAALFERLREEEAFAFIIHTAQASHVDHAPGRIAALERQAVRNLERLRGPATQLMVFTSGVWIYGNGAGGLPITEDTPLQPFAASRARVELLRELATHRDHPWTQLCPPSIVYGSVGPLAVLANELRRGGQIEVLDDDRVRWSVIERLDLGRAYGALLRRGRPGDDFVVAEDAPVGVTSFYETIAAAVGRGRVVRRALADIAATKDADWIERAMTSQPVDASRFKQRTGWRARESFATSVARLLR
jgi:nucleoside-diphosphate-sugar epimerase